MAMEKSRRAIPGRADRQVKDSGRTRAGRLAVMALTTLIIPTCSSIGPASVPRDRVDYSNALSDSWKDQMLLNMVRLRYGDAPTFPDVSSVISAYTLQGAVQATGTANIGVPNDTTTLPGGTGSFAAQGGYNDRPTITYAPLTGRKFAQSLLQPIPPSAIFSLVAAGYPSDVVIPITVRALSGIYNRTSQGDIRRTADPQFYTLVDGLRRIQLSRSFSMRREKREDEQVAIVVFGASPSLEAEQDLEFLKKILNLQAENGEVALTLGALQRGPNELAVQSRSMLEIMQEFSADIAVPEADVAAGRTYMSAVLASDRRGSRSAGADHSGPVTC